MTMSPTARTLTQKQTGEGGSTNWNRHTNEGSRLQNMLDIIDKTAQ